MERRLYNWTTVHAVAATELLARLHEAQRRFYAGGPGARLRSMLADDVRWTVPGTNAIAGRYEGIDEVMSYFAKRRDMASGTFTMHTSEILTGQGEHVAALTDGSAVVRGARHRWSTVGLYRFRGELLAACWLLPLDAAEFDRIWAAPG
jgi:ketosteroid isomerase-like protein